MILATGISGFGETSTKNFINVFLKFTDKKEAELKNEYKDVFEKLKENYEKAQIKQNGID